MAESPNEPAPEKLLIADLQHFGESLWRNEEVGEKRFSFFVTLVTAVIAALVALVKLWQGEVRSSHALEPPLPAIITGALFVLLLIGVMTYLRMLQRNHVTDEYQATLKKLRSYYSALCPQLAGYQVPVVRKNVRSTYFKGGYAETVGVINAVLLVGVLFFVTPASPAGLFLVGVLTAGLQWWGSVRRAKEPPAEYFRAGVGALILDRDGQVLALERSKPTGAWQLPQGGIEASLLQKIDRYPEPTVYELPKEHWTAKTGRGQVQRWFAFRYSRAPSSIVLPDDGEFRAYEWMTFDELIARTVDFRRPTYRLLRSHWAAHLASPSGASDTR